MIKGRNVTLKSIEKSDIDDIFRIIMMNNIGSTFTTTYKEINSDGLINFLYMTEPKTMAKVFTILLDDKVIGVVTLNNIHPIRQNAYIGVVGVDPENQNGLHGLDALRTLIDYGFNTLNLHRIYGHTYSDNPRMTAIYNRGGWVHEGTERDYAFKDGRWINRETWGILRSDEEN
jgi:RimJ/RimL family protein N-acetyltransferase